MSDIDDYSDMLDSDDDEELEWAAPPAPSHVRNTLTNTLFEAYEEEETSEDDDEPTQSRRPTRQPVQQSTRQSMSYPPSHTMYTPSPAPSSSPDMTANLLDHPTIRLRLAQTSVVRFTMSGSTVARCISRRALSAHLCSIDSKKLDAIKARVHSNDVVVARARADAAKIQSITRNVRSAEDAEIALINSIDNLAHDEFEEEAMLEANEDANMTEDDMYDEGQSNSYFDPEETDLEDQSLAPMQPVDEADEDLGDIGEMPSERLTYRQRTKQSRGDVMLDEDLMELPMYKPDKSNKSDAQRERERIKYEQRKVQLEEEKQQVIDRLLHREAPNKETEAATNQLKKKNEGPPTMITYCDNKDHQSISFPSTFHLPEWLIKGIQAHDAKPLIKCANPQCSTPKRYTDRVSMLPACSFDCIKTIRSSQNSTMLSST